MKAYQMGFNGRVTIFKKLKDGWHNTDFPSKGYSRFREVKIKKGFVILEGTFNRNFKLYLSLSKCLEQAIVGQDRVIADAKVMKTFLKRQLKDIE